MSTTIRSELSEKNKYWIERHRYYELKHFCLQYPIWERAAASIDSLSQRPTDLEAVAKTNRIDDPVGRCVEARASLLERMDIVVNAAKETDTTFWKYLVKSVTEGLSYNYLKTKLDIPCCKTSFYMMYREFFWRLNKSRN